MTRLFCRSFMMRHTLSSDENTAASFVLIETPPGLFFNCRITALFIFFVVLKKYRMSVCVFSEQGFRQADDIKDDFILVGLCEKIFCRIFLECFYRCNVAD